MSLSVCVALSLHGLIPRAKTAPFLGPYLARYSGTAAAMQVARRARQGVS